MTRNLIVLGCAGLLAFGLSFGTFAGSVPDADGDGVPDQYDNCRVVPNGPLAGTDLCTGQEDDGGDGINAGGVYPYAGPPDGYGNACDYDFNGDNLVTAADLGEMLTNVGTLPHDLQFDVTCDSLVTAADLGNTLAAIGVIALDSGLACAGTYAGPCVP